MVCDLVRFFDLDIIFQLEKVRSCRQFIPRLPEKNVREGRTQVLVSNGIHISNADPFQVAVGYIYSTPFWCVASGDASFITAGFIGMVVNW
jgi:hypothetical protein